MPISNAIDTGDTEAAFSGSAHIIEGEFQIGGQEHFYLETQVSLARPGEDGDMEVISATQNVSRAQVSCYALSGLETELYILVPLIFSYTLDLAKPHNYSK